MHRTAEAASQSACRRTNAAFDRGLEQGARCQFARDTSGSTGRRSGCSAKERALESTVGRSCRCTTSRHHRGTEHGADTRNRHRGDRESDTGNLAEGAEKSRALLLQIARRVILHSSRCLGHATRTGKVCRDVVQLIVVPTRGLLESTQRALLRGRGIHRIRGSGEPALWNLHPARVMSHPRRGIKRITRVRRTRHQLSTHRHVLARLELGVRVELTRLHRLLLLLGEQVDQHLLLGECAGFVVEFRGAQTRQDPGGQSETS